MSLVYVLFALAKSRGIRVSVTQVQLTGKVKPKGDFRECRWQVCTVYGAHSAISGLHNPLLSRVAGKYIAIMLMVIPLSEKLFSDLAFDFIYNEHASHCYYKITAKYWV